MTLKTSKQPIHSKLQDSLQVMSCFEHQYLFRQDFLVSSDFDYLIQQELPCFNIEVKKGNICLRVSHYLATIVLPSGVMLETLPKVNNLNNNFKQHDLAELVATRQWVANMIKDISEDDLFKDMSSMTYGQTNNGEIINDWGNELLFPPFDSQLNSKRHVDTDDHLLSQNRSNEPWHYSLLKRAQTKIEQAAELIPKKYQTQVNNQPRSQGKLNLSAQLKNNWHRPHYLYSEQSTFSIDQLMSQFLVTGWHQLNRLSPDKSLKVPQGIQSYKSLPPHLWKSVYRDLQLNKKYGLSQFTPVQRNALNNGIQWCWWLLTHSINSNARKAELDAPSQSNIMPTPSLMINMNHAFERWVLGRLNVFVSNALPNHKLIIQPRLDWLMSRHDADRSIVDEKQDDTSSIDNNDNSSYRSFEEMHNLANGLDNSLKHNTRAIKTAFHSTLATQGQVIQKLIPDAYISDMEEKVTHVIDIKYKNIKSVTQISGSDWQQLFIYQQYLQCQHAWLIFPKTNNFNQRLDVFNLLKENRAYKENKLHDMSAIPFDLEKGDLLLNV